MSLVFFLTLIFLFNVLEKSWRAPTNLHNRDGYVVNILRLKKAKIEGVGLVYEDEALFRQVPTLSPRKAPS